MKNILFFGELPPKTIHGASISNDINIKILKKYFNIYVVEEFSDLKFHNSFSFQKLLTFIKTFFVFMEKVIFNKYEYYYGVIYLSTFGITKNIMTSLLFKVFHPNKKVILHFHRSDFKIFINSKINYFLFVFLDLFVYKYIVLSEKQKKELEKIKISKLVTLYNTIQIELNHFDPEIVENREFGLFIGNYIEEKGIIDLIKAVKKYNVNRNDKLHLKCYGNISDPGLFEKIQEFVYTDNFITINGPILDKEKMECIKNAKFTILPSYNEGMPLSLLESISVGTPMIITNIGFINEALGNFYPLYCKFGDVDSIVECFNVYSKIDNSNQFRVDLMKIYYDKFSNMIHEEELMNIFKLSKN